MDFSCINTEIASRPRPCPGLSLTEEELDDLWFFYILEFGHLLDIPQTHQEAISALEHLPSCCTGCKNFKDVDDAAFTPAPTTSIGQLTDLIAQSSYTNPDVPSRPLSAPGSSETRPDMSEYKAILTELIALRGPTSCPAASSIAATAGNAEVEPAMTSMSDVTHAKRCRNAVVAEDHEAPPHKRDRGEATCGIQEAAQSMARTRRRPETRFPTITNNNTSKEAGCGAERLATPNAQGLYHHPSPGPSSQQGWVPTNAQGQHLPWIEKRVEEETLHYNASVVQQEEGHLFQIPSDFHRRHRILLAATEADWTCGAVDEIKCRLCPQSRFTKWEDFKRHCKVTEAHPLEISFCDHCGDFFARTDSLKRHRNRPPYECLGVTPERAEEKRRETERKHRDFMGRVERSLTTGEEVGSPFAHIIKQMYPESSKKRTGSGWERRRIQA